MKTNQILNVSSAKLILRASILSATYFLLGVASAQNATDFAIFSSSTVTLEGMVRGDVYSGGDLDVGFAYGIQDTEFNMGNMFAFEDYTQDSLSAVNGSVFANGNATLEGSADILGDLTFGDFLIAGNSTDVFGITQQQANTVTSIGVPFASEFSAGTEDVISNTSISLPPGAYRDLEMTGLFDQIDLTSGTYFFRRLDFQTGTTVSLQIVNNEPINVFLESDANFGSGLDFIVNGVEITTTSGDSVADLANLVTFESHGSVTLEAGFLNHFFGTIFAPQGNVAADAQFMYGSIVSGGPVSADVQLDHRPSFYLIGQPAPGAVLGDCNLDGVVSFLDINPFIGFLSTQTFFPEADCNEDGVVNFLDIAPFIGFLTAL